MADVLRSQDRWAHRRYHRDGLRPPSISLERNNPRLGPAAPLRVRVEGGPGGGDASRTGCDLSLRIDPAARLDAADGHLSADHEADGARLSPWNACVP